MSGFYNFHSKHTADDKKVKILHDPFKYTTCAICGKQYIRRVGSIYHVDFADRRFHCCSYTCYQQALEVKSNEVSNRYATYNKELKRGDT